MISDTFGGPVRAPNAPESQQILDQLFTELDSRGSLLGSAADDSTRRIVQILGKLRDLLRGQDPEPLHQPPPRRIATAMALAVYSQPHLIETFRRKGQPAARPLAPVPEVLERTLGLQKWQLEDLRDEVDRRASRVLKQARMLHWLWNRFGLPKSTPEPLFRVLVPGAPTQVGSVGLIRRGPQLYCVVDQAAPPEPHALFLPWLGAPDDALHPITCFQGKYVDSGLRKVLSRSIGAEMENVTALLDGMVTVIPRAGAEAFLGLDEWRSGAAATLTTLGYPYGDASWLVAPLAPKGIRWSEFLYRQNGVPVVRYAERAFDVLATNRVRAVLRQLYALILARIPREKEHAEFSTEDISIYAVEAHLRAVFKPIFDWVNCSRTVAALKEAFEIDGETAMKVLSEVRTCWEARAEERWLAKNGSPENRCQVITAHLAGTHASLRRLYAEASDARFEHRQMLLLFAAHYFAEAPVERLWDPDLALDPGSAGQTLPPPEDIINRWFWPTWDRLLDGLEGSSSTAEDTFAGVNKQALQRDLQVLRSRQKG